MNYSKVRHKDVSALDANESQFPHYISCLKLLLTVSTYARVMYLLMPLSTLYVNMNKYSKQECALIIYLGMGRSTNIFHQLLLEKGATKIYAYHDAKSPVL